MTGIPQPPSADPSSRAPSPSPGGAFDLADALLASLPYTPNPQQIAVAAALGRFCISTSPDTESAFILNGYAGTGKTSLTAALTRVLPRFGMSAVLLAPTGRAAKILSAHAGAPASTIHRRIYRHSLNGEVPGMRENRSHDTLFIVDEASMIPGPDAAGNNLLADLIHYVFTGTRCRLLLMGDTAQLPPVGSAFSPAMDPPSLKAFGLRVSKATLTAIARQQAGSGILLNATSIRKAMTEKEPALPPFRIEGFNDIRLISPQDLPDELASAYALNGPGSALVITRSNRDASAYNQGIRRQVLGYEEELVPGELLIVAKNNYHWAKNIRGLGFIANGDVVAVSRVISTETKFGFRFADVELEIPGTPFSFPAKITLDTLTGESPAMSVEDTSRLINAITNLTIDNPAASTPDTAETMRLIETYVNALQVKYAYAATCHKAQGGQWPDVFVDAGFLPPDADPRQYLRWLYTAVTRAMSRLTIISRDLPD